MKFSLKLALSVLVLLALCVSLSGYLLISRSFEDTLAVAAAQNAGRHIKDAYQIESATAKYIKQQVIAQRELYREEYGEYPDSGGAEYVNYALQLAAGSAASASGGDSSGMSLRLANGSPVYSAMPKGVTQNAQIAALALSGGEYSLFDAGGKIYMLMATPLIIYERDISLVSAFEVSAVFSSRDAQLKSLLWITAITLVIAAALTSLLSLLLTRPLARLKRSSERIAAGDYSERTDIASDDEFGALSESFDMMADSVESNIKRLEDGVREREDFVSAFTHEIKTPMTSMLGYASLLRKGDVAEKERRTALDFIWRETRRLESLSQKLMLLMGLRDEQIELEPVSVRALFSGLEKTLPKPEKDVSVRFESRMGEKVLADRALLDDLLRNLIINAVRACSGGGAVDVSCLTMGNIARFTVADDGCGIPAHELARVTEPFYMVDKSRSRAQNGSGMGLALCARIAELHGARLDIKSEAGKGTIVSFSLKAAKEAQDENE